MKIQLRSKKNRGSALILMTVGAVVIIGLSLASYLAATSSENATVTRSQAWNASMVTAEAGIEEGFSLINKYVSTSTPIANWTDTASSADGWTQNGNVYTISRSLGTGIYTVTITNNGANGLTILSTGTIPAPNAWMLLSNTNISRTVLVGVLSSSGFQGAVLTRGPISLSGNVTIDSFDSQNPLYSSNGQYTAGMFKAGGDLMSVESNVVDDVTASGTVQIYGTISMGPNDTLGLRGGATVGNTNWAGPGVDPGWDNTTANLTIPDATAVPNVAWFGMPTETNSTYVLDGGGPGQTNYYEFPSGLSLSSHECIVVTNGTVEVYSPGSFSMTANSQLTIAPNASLVCWLNGTTSLNGQGVVNQEGYAKDVTFYGTPNCTSISYSGGSAFIGTIDAPEADISSTGGATTIGSVVGKTFTESGGGAIHYDESLASVGGTTYIASSWQEVP